MSELKQPPLGFDSWIQVYDHLQSKGITSGKVCLQVGETWMNKSKTLRKIKVKTVNLTMRSIERNCWLEIDQLRTSSLTTAMQTTHDILFRDANWRIQVREQGEDVLLVLRLLRIDKRYIVTDHINPSF